MLVTPGLARIASRVRAHDWWDFKLLAIVQLYAATAVMLRVPIAPLWSGALLLLAALMPGAIFASLINDATDLADDRRGGKPNALARAPWLLRIGWPFVTIALGAAIVWLWRDDRLLAVTYVVAWLAFVAYSMPPLRLKARGGWGVVTVACGEAALPALVAALAAFRAAGRPPDPAWSAAVGCWAFCHGMRAIMWHQLGDAEADARAAIDTFVRRRGAIWVRRLAARYLFPAELIALAVILIEIGSILPLLALAAYLLLLGLRVRWWGNVWVIVSPEPNHLLLMQEYYLAYLPCAILLAAGWRNRLDFVALAAFLLLFPRPFLWAGGDAVKLVFHAARWPHAR